MSSTSRTPSNSAGSASMKQAKLKFPSSKRTASASGAKKAAGNLAKHRSNPVSSPGEPIDPKEGEAGALEDKEGEKGQLKKISTTPRLSSASYNSSIQQGSPKEEKLDTKQLPELNIKDPRWRKLFTEARAKRRGLPLVHGKDENNVHQILRVFDLNYDYGPCIGVTRLERWERAHALGLNPPLEIRDILLTREGVEQKGYSECVFYDEV